MYYQIDDFIDYFYGALLTSTSEVYLFDLVAYSDGMLLRVPSREDPGQLCPMPRQQKMFDVFKEHHEWQNIIGLRTVGDLNDAVDKGFATDIINVNEALQEKKIARIATPSNEPATTTWYSGISSQKYFNEERPLGNS